MTLWYNLTIFHFTILNFHPLLHYWFHCSLQTAVPVLYGVFSYNIQCRINKHSDGFCFLARYGFERILSNGYEKAKYLHYPKKRENVIFHD